MSSSKPPDDGRRALQWARRYLRFGTRSRQELRAYLASKQCPARAGNAVIAACVRAGWLDDRACAKLLATAWAEQGYAGATIRERLLAKGLDAQLASTILEPLQARDGDERRARLVVEARLARQSSRRDHHRLRPRLARLLARRGFDPDLIDRVLADSFESVSD